MNAKKALSNELVKKIGAAYIRLSSADEDETEVRRRLYAFTRKALTMLGLKLTADKMEERSRKLTEVAIQRAKEQLRRERYLTDLRIEESSGGYCVEFLPDVRIERTPEIEDCWRDFLRTLAAKTRIGPDPVTGAVGVLYRDGEWLGDLVLADDVRSFGLPPHIRRVAGDLVARGAVMVNKAFTHEVEVMGGLHVHHELLRQTPPKVVYRKELKLYGLKSVLDVPLPPQMLEAWGARPGSEVVVRSDHLEYGMDAEGVAAQPDAPECRLKGINVLSTYCWRGDHWTRIKQERLDSALFDKVHARLARLSLVLGLGQDMVSKSVLRTPDNIDRLGLYLDMSLAGAEEPPQGPAEAAGRLLAALDRLRAPFAHKNVDEEAVAEALEGLRMEDAEAAAELAGQPREKINEKLLRGDLALVTRLGDEAVTETDFFADGLGTAYALHLAFCSEDARANLRHALSRLDKALVGAASRLSESDRPLFADLLADHRGVLKTLKRGLAAFGGGRDTATLEAELREVANMAPKAVFRQASHVAFESEDKEFAKDRVLLRLLYEARTMEASGLDIDSGRMLGLVLSRLRSVAAPRLLRALDALMGRNQAPAPLERNLASRLADLPPDRLLGELRIWLRSLLAVVKVYNAQTVTESQADETKDRERKEMAMIGLPPHAIRDLASRMARICLLWGLGRSFVEGVDATMGEDLERLILYLDLALGRTPHLRSVLQDDDKGALDDARGALKTLRLCLDTGDADAAAEAVRALDDKALERLGNILSKPRPQVETTLLRRDRDYLDGLRNTRLTLPQAFGDSGRFLLFVNSCLVSNEMRRASSAYTKPLYFALARLGSKARGQGTTDLLRACAEPAKAMESFAPDADRDLLKKIGATMEKIAAKSIEDLASDLRKTKTPDAAPDLAADYEFLGRVLALPGTALGTLQLDGDGTVALLLANLDSPFSGELKAMHAAGQFRRLPGKRIVVLALDRLGKQMAVIRAYNKLSTPVR